MISLYFCKTEEREKFICKALEKEVGKELSISRTAAGKPYCTGGEVQFSVSHSQSLCAVAISDSPVGVDCEILKENFYRAVTASFSEKERSEIVCPRDFYMHWTAREAFCKMLGRGIWELVRRLEFSDGRIFLDGVLQSQKITFVFLHDAVTAVCSDENQITIKTLQ